MIVEKLKQPLTNCWNLTVDKLYGKIIKMQIYVIA